MDKEILKKVIDAIDSERKIIVKQAAWLQVINVILLKASRKKLMVTELSRWAYARIKRCIRIIGNFEIKRHNNHIKLLELIEKEIVKYIKPEGRKKYSSIMKNMGVKDSYLVKFLAKQEGYLHKMFYGEISDFDGSIDNALNIIKNIIIVNSISSYEVVLKETEDFFIESENFFNPIVIDFNNVVWPVRETEVVVIMDADFAKKICDLKKNNLKDSFDIRIPANGKLVITKTVYKEMTYKPKWGENKSLISSQFDGYLRKLNVEKVNVQSGNREKDNREKNDIVELWKGSSSKAKNLSAEKIEKFKESGDMSIMVYSLNRIPSSKKVILTNDNDIIGVMKKMKNTVVFRLNDKGELEAA